MSADRAYLRLLRLYPGAFRARFENGMRDAFAQDHKAARARGHAALARFWLMTIWQAIVFGLAERTPPKGSTVTTLGWVDWRDTFRSLRATPVITSVAVLSLALGTGANTALFSILNSILYKPLPVSRPSELVLLDDGSWTNPIWEQIRDRAPQFSSGAFAWSSSRFDIAPTGQTEYVPGAYVSGAMFDVLGLRPEIGRLLTPADDTRGGGTSGPVAVIGYDFWQRRFQGASDVLGKTITVARVPFSIVGVMPKGFFGADVGANLAVAIPIAARETIQGSRAELEGRSTWWLEIMARLRPEQSVTEAAAALNVTRPQIREQTLPQNWRPQDLETYLKDPWRFVSAATGVSTLRGSYNSPLTVILVIVGIVLVIACANIANVLIARSIARRHELTVRMALGATRWRLAKQLLLESLVIAVAGAALGLLFAQWSSALLVRQISSAAFLDLSPDLRVLGFTAGVAMATALLFGVAPSLGVLKMMPNDVLKERGRAVAGDGRLGVRSALVVAQVALSLALVVGAGLFLRTFSSLLTRPMGFDPDPILVVSVNAAKSATKGDARVDLFDRVREAAATVPGVESVALSFMTPMGNSAWNTLIVTPNLPGLAERDRAPWVNLVTPEWFSTYRMKLVAGRTFDERDRLGAPDVVVITQEFARKYFPGVDPVGQRVIEEDGPKTKPYDVIGVVEDALYRDIRADWKPIMYMSRAQARASGPQGSAELSVRARAGQPADLTKTVLAAIAPLDRDLSFTPRLLTTQVASSTRQERLVAMLSGFFGGLALLLAGLGLYGVTSSSVSRRRSEIGIRMALGARPDRIVRMILGRASWLVVIGIVAGAAISVWVVRYVRTLLYGVEARDPLILIGASIALAAVGLLAAWLPARRAARVDPVVTLRAE